jgi:hypothetical protein
VITHAEIRCRTSSLSSDPRRPPLSPAWRPQLPPSRRRPPLPPWRRALTLGAMAASSTPGVAAASFTPSPKVASSTPSPTAASTPSYGSGDRSGLQCRPAGGGHSVGFWDLKKKNKNSSSSALTPLVTPSPSVRFSALREGGFPVRLFPEPSSPRVALGEDLPECICHLGKTLAPVAVIVAGIALCLTACESKQIAS